MENREFLEFQDINFFWHPFSKYYLASRCGKILSLKRKEKRILKLYTTIDGYLFFKLCENNKKINYLIHRFVYETFKGIIPNEKEIDHRDSNKKNNFISNLQLLSHKENIRKSKCKKVISYDLETQEEMTFNSIKEAAEFYGIFSTNISAICKKKMKTSKSKKDGKKYHFFYFKN